jgi:hypothetical protein
MGEGLKDKEDEGDTGGDTATIEAHMVAARSGEESSAALSRLLDSIMVASSTSSMGIYSSAVSPF